MFDAHSNFGYSTIAVAPVPANSGTSITVAAGQGALFPVAPFNCTVWPPSVQPLDSNAEIVRVTAVVGDTLTIVRAQEGTSAKNIEAGWQIANTTSRKVFTDIENSMIQFIVAGGVSASAPAVEFANANGITFGAVGNTVTASHNALTTQTPVAFSAQGGSSQFQTLDFVAANGITFINSNGSVAASYTVPNTAGLISFINLSAGTTSNNLTAITFSNANGISFGLNGGVVTASYVPGAGASLNFSAGTTSNNLSAITFADANGITFGLDGGTITGSHNALTSQSNQAASAPNGSFTFQTLGFSNANGITFGTSAGSIITASHNGISIIGLSGGTQSNAVTAIVFSNANGVSFGVDGSTVTASVGAVGGGGATLSQWTSPLFASAGSAASSFSHNQPYFDKVNLSCPISFSVIRQIANFGGTAATSNVGTTAQMAYTIQFAIYSRSVTDSAATNFSNSSILVTHLTASAFHQVSASASSQSNTMTWVWQSDSTGGTSSSSRSTVSAGAWAPAEATGQKAFNIYLGASLSAGEWWFAQKNSSSSAGYAAASSLIRQSNIVALQMSNASFAEGFGRSSSPEVQAYPGFGVYTITTAALPATLNSTEIRHINFSVNQRIFQAMA